MKTVSKKIVFILMILFFISCDDILEDDISNDIVHLNSPQNNAEIYSNVVNFNWSITGGADNYRLQIFSFDSTIVLDTLIEQTSFTYPLLQGDYQWRVRAENSAYVSTYSMTNNFSVFETTDLTNQQVLLSSPTDNFYTNNAAIILSWQSLSAATSYNFELVNASNGESVVNQQSNLTNTSLTLSNSILTQDAHYKWKIKALNSSSESNFFSRNFYLDTTSPNQPANVLPANNSTQTIQQQINFSWTIPSDIGVVQSSIKYEIEFSNDVNFSAIIQTASIDVASFQRNFTSVGDYFWRVRSKDLAGNNSIVSSVFKFTIN